jgi:hypothetical protein
VGVGADEGQTDKVKVLQFLVIVFKYYKFFNVSIKGGC